MRNTGRVTISLPPDLVAEVVRLGEREGRTRSELLREVFRQYADRRRRWDQLFAYGKVLGAGRGLTEEAIATAVKDRRRAHGRAAR